LALAPVGGKRRSVLPITVVSLHRVVAAAACVRRGAGSTIATTSLEAA
jgi:hypothetical protein